MTKTIVITSGKGGVGKTNISVNAAIELARRQYRTCLFDGDLGLANVNILLGIHPEHTLDDVLFGSTPLSDIIIPTEYGVDIIPGSSGVEKMANLGEEQLSRLMREFDQLRDYDYFLFDTSSGISRGVISFCLAASETLLVLTSESTSLADAYAVLKVLALNKYRGTVKILVNKCTTVPHAKKTYLHFKSVADRHLGIEIAPGGVVLVDPTIEQAVAQQKPVTSIFPDSMASQCIRAMVSNLVKSTENTEGDTEFGRFWSRYLDMLQADLRLPGESRGQVSQLLPEEKVPVPAVGPVQPQVDVIPDPPKPTRKVRIPGSQEISSEPVTAGTERLLSPAPLLSTLLAMRTGDIVPDCILSDPVLIGKAMQVCSVSQLPQPGGVASLHRPLEELGAETVANLLRTMAMHGLLSDEYEESFSVTNGLWAHCYRCGLLTEALSKLAGYHSPEEAYLAGVLHDIGRLAMQAHIPLLFTDCADPFEHSETVLNREIETVGMSHGVLGAEILHGWGMSHGIVAASRYHVEPEDRIVSALPLTQLVYTAHRLCSQPAAEVEAVVPLAESLLGVDGSEVVELLAEIDGKLEQLAGKYAIPLAADIDRGEIQAMLGEFKRQAADYATMQTVLPPVQPAGGPEDRIRSMLQGMNLLFGLEKVVYFQPDDRNTSLQATGFPGCYGSAAINSMRYPLDSRASQVVKSYQTGDFRLVKSMENLSLADRQLLGVLEAPGLLSMPLGTADHCKGVLVCGVCESDYSRIEGAKKRLVQFTIQAAAGIVSA